MKTIWVICYNGSPDLSQFQPVHYPSRKIRAYETENIAWRSAERIFKNESIEDWKKVSVIAYKKEV